jgi:beta-barrel assembly-enhancing protease
MAPLLCKLYDGTTAHQHPVLVSALASGLELRDPDSGFAEMIPHAELFLGQLHGDQVTLRREGNLGWRLLVPDAKAPWLSAYKSQDGFLPWVQRVGVGKVVGGTIAAVALVALLSFKFIDWVVPLLPESAMRNLGERVASDMTTGYCEDPAAQAALDRMTARMFPDQLGRAEPLSLRVADSETTNAFAAPGGVVVIYRGIIDEAKSPDEVAAVIAHEFGHVKYRHPERALVRAFGIGILLGGAGGDVGAMADVLMTLANSRDYERQADAEAIAAMERANVSPAGMADFFARLEGEDSGETSGRFEGVFKTAGSYLSTHPDLGERAKFARAAVDRSRSYMPALSAQDWATVQAMCPESEPEPALNTAPDPKAD